jgi:hypothetical protein
VNVFLDWLYSGMLLVSLVSGSAAVLGALTRLGTASVRDGWSRFVRRASVLAALAGLISFVVHLTWGHTPGGPAALSPWRFVRAHVSFVVAGALAFAAFLIDWSRRHGALRGRGPAGEQGR